MLDRRVEMAQRIGVAPAPLGWACRWGQLPLVQLFLERGANPLEPDAEPWATPLAWARRGGRADVEAALVAAGAR